MTYDEAVKKGFVRSFLSGDYDYDFDMGRISKEMKKAVDETINVGAPLHKRFEALLHTKWLAGEEYNIIIHHWAEDGTKAFLDVPSPLRDMIVELQNLLCDRYLEVKKAEEALRTAYNNFVVLVGR